MEQYFNIRYEFDKAEVHNSIAQHVMEGKPGYICVADGVVLNVAQRDKAYMKVLQESIFAICDSSWVPMYVKWIYGCQRAQYCGAMIFEDIVRQKKYRMAFLGTNTKTLEALRNNIAEQWNGDVKDMLFYELPYCHVDEFDYPAIAKMLQEDGAEIVWVALGAPKQEVFMNRLNQHMKSGVQIAVGAVFNFFSGFDEKRAPHWITKHHMEFLYRIWQNPKKQLKRCGWILIMLPKMFFEELRRKGKKDRLAFSD